MESSLSSQNSLPDLRVSEWDSRRLLKSHWVADVEVKCDDAGLDQEVERHSGILELIGNHLEGRYPLPALIGPYVTATFLIENDQMQNRELVATFAIALAGILRVRGKSNIKWDIMPPANLRDNFVDNDHSPLKPHLHTVD